MGRITQKMQKELKYNLSIINKIMNQKSIIAILGVAVVVLIGATVYFATINRVSQQVAPTPKVVQQPAPIPTPVTQQPASQIPNNNEQISSVVKKFYNIYFGITDSADTQYAQTKKPVQFGEKLRQMESANVTESFFANIDSNKTPAACTTDWEGVRVENYSEPTVSGDSATVVVTLSYSEQPTNYVVATVSLIKVSGAWKMDNVTCKLTK